MLCNVMSNGIVQCLFCMRQQIVSNRKGRMDEKVNEIELSGWPDAEQIADWDLSTWSVYP